MSLDRGVQHGRGLVQEYIIRFEDQSSRHGDSLDLAAADLRGISAQKLLFNAEFPAEVFYGGFGALEAGRAFHHGFSERASEGHLGIQRAFRALENKLQPGAVARHILRLQVRDVLSVYQYPSGIRVYQSGSYSRYRGFSGTAVADYPQDLAFFKADGYVVQNGSGSPSEDALAERDRDAVKLEHRGTSRNVFPTLP